MKNFILIIIGMGVSTALFANDGFFRKTCKDFKNLEVNQRIKALEPTFQLDNPNCEIVATKSIFPRKNANGVHFEKGIQLFVYQNNKLKFICLPGWQCESWKHNIS